MSIPKEPRQQMINMMYLVLTALLALNVSAEVLNAFKLVSTGIANTNDALDSKNEGIYNALDKKMKEDPVKTEQFHTLAQQAKDYSAEMYDYIEELKTRIVDESGGYDEEGELKGMKDINTPTRIMVEKDDGTKLKQKILDTREKFLAIVDQVKPEARESFETNITLNAVDPKPKKPGAEKKTWENYNFHQIPVIAATTILTKFQNDTKSAEANIIEWLASQIGAEDFKMDKLAAMIVAPSSYVMQGQQYTADIFVSAYSSTLTPDIFIGSFNSEKIKTDSSGDWSVYETADENDIPLKEGYQKIDVKTGKGKYALTASGIGKRPYAGVIRLKDPTGSYDFYPFDAEYQVAAKSVVISPTKMNVLYIGVDNPMKISVPGVQDQQVSATMSGGSLNRGGGGYIARASNPGTAKINVSATIDGKSEFMGSEEFRVKRIPDPVPTVGGRLKGGKIQSGTLKAQSGLVALLENFDFDARFNVTSFEMLYTSKGEVFRERGSGPLFNQKMKNFMGRARPKDFIILDQIKVKGPDGTTRKLGSILFEII